jgi:alginate O-acetyltransferase complex protein AlgI
VMFTTWLYGLFLAGTVLIYWFLPFGWRSYFLLIASGVFLAYSFPLHVLLLLVVSSLVFWAAAKLEKRQFFLAASVLFVISILAYYKYQALLADLSHKLAAWLPGIPAFQVPQLVVPLGISFFTFKLLHYLIEAYRGNRQQGSYGQFLLYVFLFPILPSGPIERWPNFLGQNRELRGFRWEYLTEGCQRILTGLFKKLVFADIAAIYAANLFSAGLGNKAYWIAAYAYAMQIYFDFSGYSDIAIGSGRLFGYKIMENFNNPYFKRNISLFWKNWHISLTSWFTEYVFIPLGGSRVSVGRTIRNTMVVMALTGLWHGAALHFMVWGLYHGCGLIILRIYNKSVGSKLPVSWQDSRILTAASILLTFHFVVIGWVFFAVDFSQSLYVIRKMFFLA